MSELRKNKNVYDEFFEYTQILPSAIIKSHGQLVEDELKSFPKYNDVDRLLYFFPLLNEQKILKEKKAIFENPRVIDEMNKFDNERQSILDAWSEYTKYYKPGEKGFTKSAIKNWVLAVTMKQLILHKKNFSNRYIISRIDRDAKLFPSVKMLSYMVFYNHYFGHRKIKLSDVVDVCLASAFPYVDMIIVEKERAEIMRQIQKKFRFLRDLEVMSLKDFQSEK